MRDKEFFSEWDDTVKIGYRYDNSCTFERIIIENMIKRSCEATNGEEMFLFSPVFTLDDGGVGTSASIPYSERLLVNFMLLNIRDEKNAK